MNVDIMNKAVEEIITQRNEIKEQFIKTWLAVNVPDHMLTPEIFNKLEIVERRFPDKTTFSLEWKKDEKR